MTGTHSVHVNLTILGAPNDAEAIEEWNKVTRCAKASLGESALKPVLS